MATATWALVDALRHTAQRIATGARFRWTHMGACVCGHLAQTLTDLTPEEIHRLALRREGDWADQARELSELAPEYCKSSGLPLGDVFHALLDVGLNTHDVGNLERLADPRVRRRIPAERRRTLSFREGDDVVLYLRTWADLLAERLHDSGVPRLEAARAA